MALLVLLSALGFALAIDILAGWIAPKFGQTLPNIFTTPYLISIGIIYIPIFLYLLLHESSQKYRLTEIRADKYVWHDIQIRLVKLSSDNIVDYAIGIKNKKSYKLDEFVVKIKYHEVARTPRLAPFYPAQLAWLIDRNFEWGSLNIGIGEKEKFVVLFTREEYDGKIILSIPGPAGQPGNLQGMGGVDSDEKLMIADFDFDCFVDGFKLKTKTIRIKTEILGTRIKVQTIAT